MKFWDRIRNKLQQSPRMRSALLYIMFVVISAIFWSFLTFNSDIQLEMKVPVEINVPDSVHLLTNVPDTLSITVKDRGYRFFNYFFRKAPSLSLNFRDYSDGSYTFKVDESHLKGALGHILNKNAEIINVLPSSINIKFTDLPGKLVPVRADIIVEPREDYTQYGALIQSQDSVMVFSDAQTLSQINEVYTHHVKETDLTDTLRRRVWIAKIKDAVFEPQAIDIMVPIEKMKSQSRNIKIDVRNAPPGVKMLLFPSDVKVTYRTPVSRIKDESGITIVVDYQSVDFNASGNKVKVMIGEMPAAYQDVKLSQDSVEYIIETTR